VIVYGMDCTGSIPCKSKINYLFSTASKTVSGVHTPGLEADKLSSTAEFRND
jgi:hypothetical protein